MSHRGTTGRWVALLRGINVGGKNRLPMADLSAMFVEAGCERVETYIQSGNVVFDATRELADGIPTRITEAIRLGFGYDVAVITRSGSEIANVVASNPFLGDTLDPTKLHVAFLADTPEMVSIAHLDAERSPPDQFSVHGREVYLHYSDGAGRSKLTLDYFKRTLQVTATMRNWRTVLKLRGMANPSAESARSSRS